MAAKYRERFYFFLLKSNNTNQTDNVMSHVHAIGYNFTKDFRVVYVKKNPTITAILIEKAI